MPYSARMTSRFGDAVKAAREQRGWSKSELAERSGVARKTLTRWELGEITEPLLSQLRDVIAAMQMPPDDLLRPLGLLPPEDSGPDELDEDEHALWALGTRRGWPEELRWQLVDMLRAWRMRSARSAETPEEHIEYLLRRQIESQPAGSPSRDDAATA